ncbi:MAG: hypothetical protein MUC92_04100 [Fimbriimonadaceae bacterium]|jgi:hypothetical protein|nr:hypothetical protein [Fimbriimonadaceae bacterium]
MKISHIIALLISLTMSLVLFGCESETKMSKEEEQQFGGRQPTAEELQKARQGRSSSSDPGK